MEHKADTAEEHKIEPCHHMQTYVSALSDDTLSGPARWYTKLHILHCARCRAALQVLRALRERLRNLGSAADRDHAATLTGERRAALEKAMDEVDRQAP
jgi:hypothetical protein